MRRKVKIATQSMKEVLDLVDLENLGFWPFSMNLDLDLDLDLA